MWYLYVITSSINGKQYVGIATNVARRWVEHRCGHGSKIIYQALKKYGLEQFTFEVYCGGSEKTIKQLERVMIAQLGTKAHSGYNLTDGGEGSTGWVPSDETRANMSVAHSGSRNSMYGKKHSTETREKISAKVMGRKNPTRAELNKAYAGANNPRAQKVQVNGIQYPCIKDAAEAIGMAASTLRVKLSRHKKSNNWPSGWGYTTT